MSKIARGYAFNLKDMFKNFKHKKLQITCKECLKYFKTSHKEDVASRVFLECVKLVMNDILENNITFKLPGYNADIHMHKISGEDFQLARSRGAFKNIDFLKTNFTAYRPALHMYNNDRTRIKLIHSNQSYTNKLDEYINSGKKYY